MKECKLCGKEFPSSIVSNGKLKVLSSRKYCLQCSPWGCHNTKKLEIPKQIEDFPDSSGIRTVRQCEHHGEIEFVSRKRSHPNKYYWRCVQCEKDAVSKRRRKMKRILVEEHGGKCINCGYDKCIAALVFHHPDPTEKDFNIAHKVTRGINRLRKEAQKCLLLCHNCHTEIHN